MKMAQRKLKSTYPMNCAVVIPIPCGKVLGILSSRSNQIDRRQTYIIFPPMTAWTPYQVMDVKIRLRIGKYAPHMPVRLIKSQNVDLHTERTNQKRTGEGCIHTPDTPADDWKADVTLSTGHRVENGESASQGVADEDDNDGLPVCHSGGQQRRTSLVGRHVQIDKEP